MKVIIFDLDDTIEDYSSVAKKVRIKLAEKINKKYGTSKKKIRKLYYDAGNYFTTLAISTNNIKNNKRELWFEYIFKKVKIKTSKKEISYLVKFYWSFIKNNVLLFKGAKKLCKDLSKKYKLVILSDSDGSKKIKIDRIKKLGIYKYFDLIITTDDTKKNKPHKSNYDLIFKKLNVKPAECMMIGDKPEVDLKIAKKLGMKTIWVKKGFWSKLVPNKTYSYVDYSVSKLSSIKKILEK